MIDDLSWSGIVNQIQHENVVGADMLVEIAIEKEAIDKDLLDVEIKLQQIKTRQLQLKRGSLLILRHLEKQPPLVVKRKDFIVIVSDEDIIIERNVL